MASNLATGAKNSSSIAIRRLTLGAELYQYFGCGSYNGPIIQFWNRKASLIQVKVEDKDELEKARKCAGITLTEHQKTLPPNLLALNSNCYADRELAQNYINGTIPIAFGQLPLRTLNLLDNRISGSIPQEIANIDTLEELIMEDNQMGGTLPPELGRLGSLRRLRISDLNGNVSSFPNLQNMKNMRFLILRNCVIEDSIPPYIAEMRSLYTF
ncbi:hypothetical protein POM88_045419 [Heracleum sosnowskyi]|uniref:Leucine-rich repeat protein n=1 Tax=Heracleum sosnowskyi TaxID=360622 RepID=A0AAD8M3U4_9APIA|nr:hypothetical protein POM88_045419 [Heracleum sosnowskyi]